MPDRSRFPILPILTCSSCEKNPVMIIKSVNARLKDAVVQYACMTCDDIKQEIVPFSPDSP